MSSCFKLISSSCIRQTHTLLKKDSSYLLNRCSRSTNSTLAFTNLRLNEVNANNVNNGYVYARETKSNMFRKHRRVDFQINVPFSKTQERKYSTNVTDNLDILLDPGKNPRENEDIESLFQAAMQKVPQSVTTGKQDKNSSQWIKRGITCSSFTSVSFKPPILSLCIHRHSRMHDLLQETEKFAVHVLAQDQVRQSLHFASSWTNESCPFDTIPHVHGEEVSKLVRYMNINTR